MAQTVKRSRARAGAYDGYLVRERARYHWVGFTFLAPPPLTSRYILEFFFIASTQRMLVLLNRLPISATLRVKFLKYADLEMVPKGG